MKVRDFKKEINIYLNSEDKYEDKQLYKVLVDKFIEIGVTGCTIVSSNSGYGMNMKVRFLDDNLLLSSLWNKDSTVIIRVIETPTIIEAIVKLLDEFLADGIVTIKDVDFIRYTKSKINQEDVRIAENY